MASGQQNPHPPRDPTAPGKPAVPHRWNEACRLELIGEDLDQEDGFKTRLLWLKSADGAQVYRREITEEHLSTGRGELEVEIDPVFIFGDTPRTYVVKSQLENGSWAPEVERSIPESFRQRHGDLLRWIASQEIPARSISFCPIGGLANQLYTGAAMFGFARRHGRIPVCEVWKNDSPSMIERRPTYWDTVFPEIVKLGAGYRRHPYEARNYGDPAFTYTEIPEAHDHQILWGHYPSYKYFHSEREELLDLLWGCRSVQQRVDAAYHRLVGRLPSGTDSLVSLHVRRGDSLLNHGLTRMNLRYYEEAMTLFPHSVFAIFSDDIEWCRNTFQRRNVLFVEGNPDWVDLYLMARCDHHIIANSTYSWWGAYLNRESRRRVVYPMPWFAGEKRERDMSDFFLPNWTEVLVHEP